MSRVDFETRMAELEARIAECPADQQDALRQLADETRERQAAIDTSIRAARLGAEKLRITEELAMMNFAMVADAAGRMRGISD
jgi:uncharacterized coiled-coil protein SlyX